MIARTLPVFFLFFLLVLTGSTVTAQAVVCPSNLDFEEGNFNNWEMRFGQVTPNGDILWQGTGMVDNRHTIIPASTTEMDFYGGFPKSCPNGSGYSIRLGNDVTGAQVEGISFTYSIPAFATSFSIIYHYAVVLQNPEHLAHEQPRFLARILDDATGVTLDCVSFDFTASSSLPGFKLSSFGQQVLYKDWTPISVDLGAFAGKTIRLEFITMDCCKGGHFGYAYMDVNSSCNGSIAGTTLCEGEQSYALTAPYGFQQYQWFSNNTFSTPLSATQVLNLDPVPASGSVYPVIVTPYPGFGCPDTLYATINRAAKPPSVAGPDQKICFGQTVQLGSPPVPDYLYSWSPGEQVTNRTISNPFIANNLKDPVSFIIKTTDLNTNCFSFDTTIVTPYIPDTALTINGKTNYCVDEPMTTSLQVSNSITAIQWYLEDNPVAGAVNTTYKPVTPGNYWAQLNYQGCLDSTRRQLFVAGAYPVAGFTVARDTQCINTPVSFINTSTIAPQESLTYQWDFGNNSTATTENPLHTYTAGGIRNIRLIVSTANQCKDTLDKPVLIAVNSKPDFTWDSICINRPVQFTNLTNDNDAIHTDYSWDFGNSILSAQVQPDVFSFSQAGSVDIKLQATSTGCEHVPLTVTKKVIVNTPAQNVRYRDVRVGKGTSTIIEAKGKDVAEYEWQPQIQLSDYMIKRPSFLGSGDVRYAIKLTDIHNCISTDTLQVWVMDKTGIYLPSAFTPNGDGLNDIIKPFIVGMKSMKRFTVYSRSGNIVFSSTAEGDGWDGKYKGRVLDPGVFVWMIEYVDADDKSRVDKGTITLIR